MKIANTVLTLGVGLLLAAAVLPAQPAQKADDAAKVLDMEIAMMRKDLRDQVKQIVAANMPLTGDEAARFWPVYDQYAAEVTKINDKRFALVKEYAATYNTLTEAQAAMYIRGSITIDESAAKLRLEWIPKFEKLLGEKKAAIFFQIDRRIGMMRELQLAAQIPLVQP